MTGAGTAGDVEVPHAAISGVRLLGEGSTLFVSTDGMNKLIKLAAGSTSLWGYLVTVGPYTPTAQRVHIVTLLATAAF
jgi:hypothetical protein